MALARGGGVKHCAVCGKLPGRRGGAKDGIIPGGVGRGPFYEMIGTLTLPCGGGVWNSRVTGQLRMLESGQSVESAFEESKARVLEA